MKKLSLLSPKDIYIEINGVRVAGVKNYRVNITRDVYKIYSFKELQPVKIIPLSTSFNIELSKISLLEHITKSDFLNLSNFNLIIAKPKVHLIFSDCNWTFFSETIDSDNSVIKSLSLVSTKRIKYKYS